MDGVKFQSVPTYDEEEGRGRESRSVELESVRVNKSHSVIRNRRSSAASSPIPSPGPQVAPRKQEPEDPLSVFLTQYAWYIQMVVVFVLYVYSLDSCTYSRRKCQKLNSGHIKFWIIALLVAAYVFATCLLAILYKMMVEWATQVQLWMTNILLFLTFLSYMFLCSLKEGLTWEKHGTLSRIVFNYFLLIIVTIRLVHHAARSLANKGNSWAKYLLLGALYSFLGWFVLSRLWGAKETYYTGLGGKKLIYDHVYSKTSAGVTKHNHTEELCRFHKF